MSKLSESSIMAARLARAKQSNKESGKEEVVLTGAAMHGLSQRDATEDAGGQQGSSSSAGAGPLDSEQRDMMAQMQQAQEELDPWGRPRHLPQAQARQTDPGDHCCHMDPR